MNRVIPDPADLGCEAAWPTVDMSAGLGDSRFGDLSHVKHYPKPHTGPERRDIKPVHLPTCPTARKGTPITTGVLDYFPLALAEVARVSKEGNDQHNPGQPMHWDKTKSLDHADCIARHLIDRGALDDDGMRHSAKLAWRALALLQTELEKAK